MAAVRSEEQFLCSICLEVFSKPVTIPCGHNFCKGCITQFWDNKEVCLCPLCKKSYDTKPEMNINALLQEMALEFKQQQKMQYEVDLTDVICDYCTDPKLKALKSCLVCVSSYCETHLQPHLTVPRLKSHQLMDPVNNLEDRMCRQHQKPLELFCRSEDSCLCTMCLLEHKNHEFVSLKEEYDRKKTFLQQTQTESQNMVEQRRLKIQEIQQCLESSQKVSKSEKFAGKKAFTALKQFVQRRQDQFEDKIEEKQKQIQKKAEDLVQQLKQEICELEKRSSQAELLQRSGDHLHFLQHFTAQTLPAGLKEWSSVTMELESCEGSVVQALSELEKSLSGELKQMPSRLKLYKAQQFAVDVTVDTDHLKTVLSEDQQVKQGAYVKNNLSITALEFSKSFYFEVQVKEKTFWTLGVKSVNKNQKATVSPENGFWAICLKDGNEYEACAHQRISLSVKCPPQKIGVFVNYDEGVVSFYDVDCADVLYLYTKCCFREKLQPYFTSVSAECICATPLNKKTVESSCSADTENTGGTGLFGERPTATPAFGQKSLSDQVLVLEGNTSTTSSCSSTAPLSGFGCSAMPTFSQHVGFDNDFGLKSSSGDSLGGSSSGIGSSGFGMVGTLSDKGSSGFTFGNTSEKGSSGSSLFGTPSHKTSGGFSLGVLSNKGFSDGGLFGTPSNKTSGGFSFGVLSNKGFSDGGLAGPPSNKASGGFSFGIPLNKSTLGSSLVDTLSNKASGGFLVGSPSNKGTSGSSLAGPPSDKASGCLTLGIPSNKGSSGGGLADPPSNKASRGFSFGAPSN